jgi:hypothetical protein
VVESPSANKSQTNMPSLAERVDRHGEVHDRQGVRSANGIDRERRFLMVGRASPRCGSAEIAGHSVRCSARRGTGTRRDWQVCSRRCGRGGDCGSRRTRGGLLRFVGIRAQHPPHPERTRAAIKAGALTQRPGLLALCLNAARTAGTVHDGEVGGVRSSGSSDYWSPDRDPLEKLAAVRCRSHREVSVPM